MEPDESFEPVIARVVPPRTVRAKSAAGLVSLLVVLGVAVGVAATALVLMVVLSLNNAL